MNQIILCGGSANNQLSLAFYSWKRGKTLLTFFLLLLSYRLQLSRL